MGGDVLAQCADVSTPADLATFVDAAVRDGGASTPWCTTPGRASAGAIEAIDDTIWESDIELKLMAAVRLTRLALPYLRASHGAMLFTLAMAAKAPGTSSEPSSVTRAAGMALMKALSKELAPDGIRVNAILIGLIESGQWSRIAEGSGMTVRAFYDRFAEDAGIPLGRFGRAAEFADLGCFAFRHQGLVPHGDGDQPRWRSVALRLSASCNPLSPSRRPPRPARDRRRSRRPCPGE